MIAPAHPRSRGENVLPRLPSADFAGSSPLTRGKRVKRAIVDGHHGLIPAHAGKTRVRDAAMKTYRGSSPLTRGKPIFAPGLPIRIGLIPAHAGKTPTLPPARSRNTAHPRSRGENQLCSCQAFSPLGSSPLTRGKLDRVHALRVRHRLIPAHAGKTGRDAAADFHTKAHPRSRGENPRPHLSCGIRTGSSPLTRGKQGTNRDKKSRIRLIPAHAGKTDS